VNDLGEFELVIGRFTIGLLLIGGMFLLVQRLRVRESLPNAVGRLFEERLHYGLVGGVIGYTSPPALQTVFSDCALLAGFFFAGWFGMLAGLGLDVRNLRGIPGRYLLYEMNRAVVICLGIVVLTFLVEWIEGIRLQGAALLMLCGVCVAYTPGSSFGAHKERKAGWGRGFIPTAGIGIVLAGLGSMQLRGGPFEIRQPFAPSFKVVEVDSLLGEVGWCLLLGAVTGIVLDLLVREGERTELSLLIAGGLALGAGLAVVLGLEPLWVGLVSGAWLINSTLRRLDIFQVVERGHLLMKIGLYFVVGWLLGFRLQRAGLDAVFFLWFLMSIAVIRPAVLWVSERITHRLPGITGPRRVDGKRGVVVEEFDTLGLVVGLGVMELVGGAEGVGALAGVMVGQVVLNLGRTWLSPKISPGGMRSEQRQGK